MRKSRIKSINDIHTDIDEGALLLMAVGTLMSVPGYTDKTPEEILNILSNKVEEAI